eukprot:jgi/Picre1/31854/NNA_007202.t1
MKWSVFVVCAALLASVARARIEAEGWQETKTEDRLLTAIRDPKVLRRDGDAITVGFVTGPNLPKTQFVVKCVAGDGGCDAPAQGISEQGFLPFKPSEVEATVEGLDPDAPYSCFVEAFFKSTGKFSFVREPMIGSRFVQNLHSMDLQMLMNSRQLTGSNSAST